MELFEPLGVQFAEMGILPIAVDRVEHGAEEAEVDGNRLIGEAVRGTLCCHRRRLNGRLEESLVTRERGVEPAPRVVLDLAL